MLSHPGTDPLAEDAGFCCLSTMSAESLAGRSLSYVDKGTNTRKEAIFKNKKKKNIQNKNGAKTLAAAHCY